MKQEDVVHVIGVRPKGAIVAGLAIREGYRAFCDCGWQAELANDRLSAMETALVHQGGTLHVRERRKKDKPPETIEMFERALGA